jgi:hypothetical protein
MNSELLKPWMRKQRRMGFVQHLLLGGFAFVAGVVVLFLTFWLTYGVIWFGWQGVSAVSDIAFSRKLHLNHEIRLACSGVFLVLLFVQHFRTDPWHWGDYPRQNYVDSPGAASHLGPAGSLGLLLVHPGASANMIADILLSGPRLVLGALKMFSRGAKFRRLDENGCAELLAFLQTRSALTPYEELISAGWEPWLEQLRLLEGLSFLQKGVILSLELRTELNALEKG